MLILSEEYLKLHPYSPAIIADFTSTHDGCIDQFKSFVEVAKKSGVGIIKTQIPFSIERSQINGSGGNVFKNASLTSDEWVQVVEHVRAKGMQFYVDVFGSDSLDVARKLDVDGFKIHSEEINNFHLIADVVREGKIILIDVGRTHRIRIYSLLKFLSSQNLCNNIVLMAGERWPQRSQAHLLDEIDGFIKKYSGRFGVKVGCAHHSRDDDFKTMMFPLIALAKGACVIEMRICISRITDPFPDYYLNNLSKLVNILQSVKSWLVPAGQICEVEKLNMKGFKKTPSIVDGIKAGESLSLANVRYVYESQTRSSLCSNEIVGRKVLKELEPGQHLSRDHLLNHVGGVILVRCGSSRLPNKALLPIAGKPSIVWLIERIKRCCFLDSIVLATSTEINDDPLESIANDFGINCYRGDLENISKRILGCAVEFGLDHIVRITGDDLLRDEIIIDNAINSHLHSSCDVTITSGMPYGTQTEIFTREVIETIVDVVMRLEDHDYLEGILQNERLFDIDYYQCPYKFNEKIRLTLDYKNDADFFELIFRSLGVNHGYFSLEDVLNWTNENPEVLNINSHLLPRYNLKRNPSGCFETNDLELIVDM